MQCYFLAYSFYVHIPVLLRLSEIVTRHNFDLFLINNNTVGSAKLPISKMIFLVLYIWTHYTENYLSQTVV